MIVGYKNKITESVACEICPKGFSASIFKAAYRKLAMLEAAVQLSDLRSPPGNHLEELKGNREGQHSIRINNQWRICFVWTAVGPDQVEIVDYH